MENSDLLQYLVMTFIRLQRCTKMLNIKGHSSQIQQGSGIDVLKSSSNFYHLIVSMREVLPENFSFIAQSSLTLWLFKVLGIARKFPVCKFL